MGRADGKVAVVTGARGGIGSAVVRHLLDEGASVACLDLDVPNSEVVDELGDRAFGVSVDVSDETSVREGVARVVEVFGEITALVNVAGVLGVSKPPHEVDRVDFDRTFAINVTGTWLMTKHVVPSMMRAGHGSIVNMASVAGLLGGTPMSTYHATKGAIRSMSKADAVTYAPHRVRVNSIYPGSIATPMSDLAAANSPEGAEAYRRRLDAAHPLGRRGEPSDVAFGVVYLVSDESAFVTGLELVIDGGFSSR